MKDFVKLIFIFASFFVFAEAQKRILLRDLGALTLHKTKYTTGRRSSPIPQLSCQGGSAGCSKAPSIVQCRNVGFDGNDVQWECKAELDNNVQFGELYVACEGYDYPDDPYVLVGSCGLEYTLELSSATKDRGYNTYSKKEGGSFASLVPFLMVVGAVVMIFYFCLGSGSTPAQPPRPPSYDFPHRPHQPGHDSRPPPYSDDAPPPPGFKGFQQGHSGTEQRQRTNTQQQNQNDQSPFGGFWTGAGLGGLLGYMFGSRTNTAHQYHDNPGTWNNGWGSGWWGNNAGTRRRGWFDGWGSGGTGSGWTTTDTWSSQGPSTWNESSTSSSSGSRTSSGFGETRRR